MSYEQDREDNAVGVPNTSPLQNRSAVLNRILEDLEPIEDALGQDLLQAYLAACYAAYMRQATVRLVDFVHGTGSPLVHGMRKVDA